MKVSVITGASGGIEQLAALYLADDYMVFGIDKEKQEKINNERYFHINGDLYLFSKDKKYRESIIGNLEEKLPKDIEKFVIVNNAAKQILKPVQKIQWRDWEESLSVNSITPFFMARDLINIFNSSDGHIANISSIHAKLTKSNFTAYSASKAALESITRSLAIELSSLEDLNKLHCTCCNYDKYA